MARTKAHSTRDGKKTYGKNYENGIRAEEKAARSLRASGWDVVVSPGSRGRDDIIATKGGKTRKIQVKSISSRALMSADVAKRRVQGKPYNAGRLSKDREIWVYDRDGRCYRL